MTVSIPIYAALAPSRAAEQLVEALREDARFDLVGHSDDLEILGRDLACFESLPALVLLDADLCPEPATQLRTLVRRFAARIIALSFREEAAPRVEAMLLHGAVHGHALQVDPSGRLDPRRLQRQLHLFALLADVRGLDPTHPTHAARHRAGRSEGTGAAETTGAAPSAAEPAAPSPKTTQTGGGWNVIARFDAPSAEPSFTSDPGSSLPRRSGLGHFQLIGIVSSTGGLSALETVLAGLPHDFPLPVAVVQHLSVGSEAEFVRLLGSRCELAVCLVERAVRPKPGTVYVAPGGQHVRVDALGHLVPSDEPREAPYRPSASVLLGSMADALGARCIGVVLTGMGDDGAEGLLRIRQCGGRTLVQDRSTSRIFGMPQAAIRLAAAERVLPLHAIAGELLRLARVGHEA